MAERAERGLLLIRSVAPVAEWLRWDGGGGSWAGWRWGSPQRERAGRGQGGERGARGGYTYRTVPAGWRHQAPSMAQVAPAISGRAGGGEAVGGSVGGEGVGVGGAFLHLEERDGDREGGGGGSAACFGQVTRRLGRLLKRLPKSRSWSDSLRMLRRSSSNGSLLNSSGRSAGGSGRMLSETDLHVCVSSSSMAVFCFLKFRLWKNPSHFLPLQAFQAESFATDVAAHFVHTHYFTH